METITNTVELENAIRQLELDKRKQGLLLKESCIKTFLQLDPMNRLEEQTNPAFPFSLRDKSFGANVAAWFSGYLIRKWITGKTNNPIRRVLGSVLQLWVANIITQYSGRLVSLSRFLYHVVFSKSRTDNGTG